MNEIMRLLSSITTETAWISIFTEEKFNAEIYGFVTAHNFTGTDEIVGPFQTDSIENKYTVYDNGTSKTFRCGHRTLFFGFASF
uniref:Uncharacterized protein n=1 Tax=Panagrolaimus superbus TaxID=310955 RepID=A0A914Y7I3_9BILA